MMCFDAMNLLIKLHTFKNGRQFPFVYCLLPGKSRTVYLRVLELIKQKSEDLGHTLAPVEVLTDFELAIIQAVELTFPTTEVKGCFFHFAQALNRKISILGLQPAYRQNQDVSKFVRQTVALAFVPHRFIRLAWQAIKLRSQLQPLIRWMSLWLTSRRLGWWGTLLLGFGTSFI